MNWLSMLKQPYPYYYIGKDLRKMSLLVLLFALVFYITFRPFEINTKEHRFGFVYIASMHALVPAFVMLIQGFFNSQFLRSNQYWTLGKELLYFAVFLSLVGLGQFLIRDLIYFNDENWSTKYLLEEMQNTWLIGGLFLLVALPINYSLLLQRNISRSLILQQRLEGLKGVNNEDQIIVKTQVSSEDFELKISEFLYAQADRNYLEIFIYQDGNVQKLLKRLSLKALSEQLNIHRNMLQTHRSFLVNMEKVESVKGNALGYQLQLSGVQNSIPVSRNRIEHFNAKFESLTN